MATLEVGAVSYRDKHTTTVTRHSMLSFLTKRSGNKSPPNMHEIITLSFLITINGQQLKCTPTGE